MAATATNRTANGPHTTMYTLKPYQTVDVVQLPDVMYKMKPYHGEAQEGSSPRAGVAQPAPSAPVPALERRQEDLLARLDVMRETVERLETRYKVKVTPPASASGSGSQVTDSGAPGPQIVLEAGRTLDLAVSADPCRVPLSLVVLAEQISGRHATLLSTYVHSSLAGGDIPGCLHSLLRSNSGMSRADCRLAVTLVWKKVSHGPQLVVDPVHQTSIQGEVNVARYLWGLLGNSAADPGQATLEDELADLAQLQVLDGSSKERAGAVRRLNSALGRQSVWLMGGVAPSLADIVCWSAVQQAGLVKGAPDNVQRWLTACKQHAVFASAQALVDSLDSLTS